MVLWKRCRDILKYPTNLPEKYAEDSESLISMKKSNMAYQWHEGGRATSRGFDYGFPFATDVLTRCSWFYPPATYATLRHKIFWEYQDMSKIEIDGFLSNEADEGRNLILNSYREAFVLAKDLNRQSMSLFQEYSLCMNNEVKIAIAALMSRIVETYQGVIIMLERGMTSQARILVRSQLEALFQMAAMVKNPNLYDSYAAKHYRSTISTLKAAK